MTHTTTQALDARTEDDTEGHFFWVPVAVFTTGAVLIGRELTKGPEALPPPKVGPLPTGAPETINVGGHRIPV